MTAARYTLEQHVEDLAAFIRALDVGPVHLVGGSYGPELRVADTVAVAAPARHDVDRDQGRHHGAAHAADERNQTGEAEVAIHR
jgi:pimeloyl-ACP methyl ester carboxylesterase